MQHLTELRSLVSARVASELADAIKTAAVGRSGEDAIRACMHAWRDYARTHSHRYSALIQRPEPHTGKAAQPLLESVFTVVSAAAEVPPLSTSFVFGEDGSDGDRGAVRDTWQCAGPLHRARPP